MGADRPCTGLDPDTYECPHCGTILGEPCPYEGLDPALLDPTKAVGGGTPTAACNPDDGVCEACQ